MPFHFVDMEATYAEFEEWSEQGVSDTIKHHYKKALQQMEKLKPFEESLVNEMPFITFLIFLFHLSEFSFSMCNTCLFLNYSWQQNLQSWQSIRPT